MVLDHAFSVLCSKGVFADLDHMNFVETRGWLGDESWGSLAAVEALLDRVLEREVFHLLFEALLEGINSTRRI